MENCAAFGPTANPRREIEQVAYRRMRNLIRISDRKIHFKNQY
jgi:hypothetical protein